jgi:CRP/FNR family transcriptional regulator, cyclic AMP receptor protein
MAIDFSWLEENIFSRRLTGQEREALQDAISIERFAKGDVVIMQQESGGRLYLLKSGRVDVNLEFNGESLKLADCGEGAQLGDMSFIDDTEASASIIAKEDCIAYRLTRDGLAGLFASHHGVARDIMVSIVKNMSSNLRHMNKANAVSLQYIQGRRV